MVSLSSFLWLLGGAGTTFPQSWAGRSGRSLFAWQLQVGFSTLGHCHCFWCGQGGLVCGAGFTICRPQLHSSPMGLKGCGAELLSLQIALNTGALILGKVIGYGRGMVRLFLQLHTSIPFSLHPQAPNVAKLWWTARTTRERINKFLEFIVNV